MDCADLLAADPIFTDESLLAENLTPSKSITEDSIQKAVNHALVGSKSSKPASPKKKKKSRTKSLTDIISVEETEDKMDHDFRQKYISKNSKWDKQLKTAENISFKRSGKQPEGKVDSSKSSDPS